MKELGEKAGRLNAVLARVELSFAGVKRVRASVSLGIEDDLSARLVWAKSSGTWGLWIESGGGFREISKGSISERVAAVGKLGELDEATERAEAFVARMDGTRVPSEG